MRPGVRKHLAAAALSSLNTLTGSHPKQPPGTRISARFALRAVVDRENARRVRMVSQK
jgi:hypothetical protein